PGVRPLPLCRREIPITPPCSFPQDARLSARVHRGPPTRMPQRERSSLASCAPPVSPDRINVPLINSRKFPSNACPGTAQSTAVRAVDIDIAVGEIACPNAGFSFAHTDIDGYRHLAAHYGFGCRGFIIAGHAHALLRHDLIAEGDFHLVAVGCFA